MATLSDELYWINQFLFPPKSSRENLNWFFYTKASFRPSIVLHYQLTKFCYIIKTNLTKPLHLLLIHKRICVSLVCRIRISRTRCRPVWHVWVFVYGWSGCGVESRCSLLRESFIKSMLRPFNNEILQPYGLAGCVITVFVRDTQLSELLWSLELIIHNKSRGCHHWSMNQCSNKTDSCLQGAQPA